MMPTNSGCSSIRRALWGLMCTPVCGVFPSGVVVLFYLALSLHTAQSLQPSSMSRVPSTTKLAEVHWESPWQSLNLWSFTEPPRPRGEVGEDYSSGSFFVSSALNEWRRKDPFVAYSRQADTRPYSTDFWAEDVEDWSSPSAEDYDDEDNRAAGDSWWSHLLEGLSIPRLRIA